MAGNCTYSCSNPPKHIPFNADITGPGVIVGFLGAAGLLIILVTAHYFIAYQPQLDPFRDTSSNSSPRPLPFCPNPVDLMVLKTCRRASKPQNTISSISRWSYLDTQLTKCVLAMSDLQLATGIAILISGYSQLRCGLSSFHWLIIGRLAWFATLTHLASLTFLRNYLYNRKAERKWRLLFMSILLVMLITAVVPTGNYHSPHISTSLDVDRGPGIQEANDYAICHFFIHGPSRYPPAFASMVVLVLIAVLGFAFRIVKLFQPLSLFIITVRSRISQRARRLLRVVYDWRNATKAWQRVLGNMLYYPLLALFLEARAVMDNFSSMFFEVYWLIAGFLWAVYGFLGEAGIIFPFDDAFDDIKDRSWSFGQVMPVVLLALPLITILQTLHIGEGARPTVQSGDPCAATSPIIIIPPRPSALSDFDPDKNYYQFSSGLKAASVYILLWSFTIGALFLFSPVISSALQTPFFLIFALLTPPVMLWAIILVSLPIDCVSARKGAKWPCRLLQILNVFFFTCASGCLIFYVAFDLQARVSYGWQS
ncbi:uncharacterized protein BJX67DRAFT_241981 [Aspergillus lucknowensis]|uniref:Uncharacterized protein n=1 Tax=Aspergillus lucknowensis TaxID=176173 RepID=A0ABR4M162_9EURO